MSKPLFQTRNLAFRDFIQYPDLVIPSGQVVFITGSSGTGKTTLLRLLNGSENPSSGTLFYRDQPVEDWDVLELRRQVSLVAQDPFLFPGSIRDNFHRIFALRERPLPTDQEMAHFLALCQVFLPPDAPTDTLSGGEKQRVYLALFLSLKPQVLLLDEPTSALDVGNAQQVLSQVIGYCQSQDIDILVVSHDPALQERYSEHTINLAERRTAHEQ